MKLIRRGSRGVGFDVILWTLTVVLGEMVCGRHFFIFFIFFYHIPFYHTVPWLHFAIFSSTLFLLRLFWFCSLDTIILDQRSN